MLRIYDYRCESTGTVFEKMNRNRDDITCNCGAVAKRLISPIKCKLDNSYPGYAMKGAKDHEKGAGKSY